jgi:hypothetical protein
VPSVLLATALPWLLPDSPDKLQGSTGSFLSQQELQLLKQEVNDPQPCTTKDLLVLPVFGKAFDPSCWFCAL